jgi:hypothetical protein
MLAGMDNMYRPAGGDPQDSRSTEQLWAMNPGSPASSPPPGPFSPGSAGLSQHYARDRRHALHWTVGLTAAVLLAAGGILAGLSLGGGSSPAASTSAASTPPGGTGPAAGGAPSAQAAMLNSALNSAGAPGPLALTSAASVAGTMNNGAARPVAAHPCLRARRAARAARIAGRPRAARAARVAASHCRGLRRRIARVVLLRGIDGQFTFRTADGAIRTLAFERGVVQSATSSAIVVKASDGTTWTWDLVSSTVVRENGSKTQPSALAAGQPVWVGGPVVSGTKDARLIVIRPPGGGSSASPAPSPSASGS